MNKTKADSLKENKGSSLIMALVVVSFIAVIAMTVMTVSLSSYKVKAMEARTKNAFYNADMAVDEIYAGLAADAYSGLAESYDYVVGNLLEVDGDSVAMIDNTAANRLLRNTYFRNACFEIFGGIYGADAGSDLNKKNNIKKKIESELNAGSLSSVNNENLSELSDKLKGYLSDAYKNVSGTGEIEISVGQRPEVVKNADNDISSIIIKNVTITYQNTSTDYFSQLTTDYEIVFPEKSDINIVDDDSDILQSFRDYALVSDKTINSAGSISVDGGIYGKEGIFHSGSYDAASPLRLSVNNGNIVTNGLIRLSKKAGLTLGNGRIWADNIELIDSDLVINSDASAYVADDLTLTQGSGSNSVTISGDYYGYSIEGHGVDASNSDPAKSSAIIINSKKSKLDFSNIRTLILGGYGWVVYHEDTTNPANNLYYRTGESIAVRYAQTAYILPSSWNGRIDSNFFAKKLLKDGQPVIVNNTDDGETEYYYNFSSGDAAASFYRGLYDDVEFIRLCAGSGIVNKNFADKCEENGRISDEDGLTAEERNNLAQAQNIRANIRSIIDEAYADFLDYDGTGTRAITINPDARVYEKGVARDSASGVNEFNKVGDETVNVLYNNSTWRQKIVGSLLIELEDDWMYNKDDWQTVLPILNYGSMRFSYRIASKEELEKGAVENILSGRKKLENFDYPNGKDIIETRGYYYVENEEGENVSDYAGNKYVVYAQKGDMKLSENLDSNAPRRGIIIVDGDVTADQNFEGCIIATGSIKLEGAEYKANPGLIDTILKELPGVRGFFDGKSDVSIGWHRGYNHGKSVKQPDEKEKGDLNSYAASDCVNIANYRRSATPQTEQITQPASAE